MQRYELLPTRCLTSAHQALPNENGGGLNVTSFRPAQNVQPSRNADT